MESVLDDCLAQFSSKYVLKEERRQAVLGLLEQEDVVAVLYTTGFGKILIYQLFAAVKLTGAPNVNFWKISVRKTI